MKIDDFCSILNNLNYRKNEHTACGNIHKDWVWYNTHGGQIDRVSISYVVDSSGIIRQQFSDVANIISLTIFEHNGRAPGSIYIGFSECIHILSSNCYGDKIYLRDMKLKELGI